MADVKKLLKDARDAIARKDYEEAQKMCRSVLKKDKENYMALVFYGVALQDSDQAPLAFQKAISLHDDRPLAYQGLLSYYEKLEDDNSKKQLVPIYTFLIKTEVESSKVVEMFIKLLAIVKHFKEIEFLDPIWNFDDEKKNILYPELSTFITENKFDKNEKLINIFENIINKTDPENIKDAFLMTYLNYLTFENTEKVIKTVKNFDRNILKEWFCKQYLYQFIILHKNLENEVTEMAIEYSECPLNSEIIISLKATILYQQQDYISSYICLQNLFDNNFDGVEIVLLKSYCCVKLKRWNEAKITVFKLLNNDNEEIVKTAKLITMILLLNQQEFDENKKIENVLTKNDELNEFAKSLMLIKSKKFEEAEDCIGNIKNKCDFAYLYSELIKIKSFSEETINMLESKKVENPSFWFPLALCYWNNKMFKKAVVPLLHAAKNDPQNYKTFLLLGHYYNKEEKNYEKAKKCYLKSFLLNPECPESGKYLSEIYRRFQNWDENLEFLNKVAKNRNITDPWASLELGLHYFALQEWDKCIINLRNYVRNSPNDEVAWESLADAYFSRGSFTSALKCYQKKLEFSQDNKYTIVQIGCIQNLLSEYNEALKTLSAITDEDYVPAINGKASVHLSIAVEKYTESLFGASRHHAQKTYDILLSALSKYSKFVCFWKKIAEAVVIITKLPEDFSYLTTKKGLLKGEELYKLAIECFSTALKLETKTNTHLYYELSCIYYDYFNKFNSKENINKALYCIKLCLETEKQEWRFWNLLGLICMSNEIKKYQIAQHAFIKASQLDESNALIWSNIGILYYLIGNKLLSNKALKKAQQFNPDCYQSWIGQALIAESVGHDDAMDLFRHSSQLGFHRESSLGYAEWVCKTILLTKKQGKSIYAIENMHAVPTAFDLMTWFHKYEKSDSCSLNIYAVLLEKMGLLNEAKSVYESAIKYVDNVNKNTVLLNLGRILTRLNDFENAINVLNSITEMNFHSVCILAYTLYKNNRFSDAFQLYSSNIQWFSENNVDKSELFVMLAALCFKSSDLGDPQGYLFQGIQQCGTTMPLLLSMFSLSSLMSALPLTQLVIAEMSKKRENLKYVALVETYIEKNENPVSAIRKLMKYVHKYPDQHFLWQYISKYHETPKMSSICAKKSVIFNDSKSDVIKDIKTISYAELCCGNYTNCKIYAQKAIRVNPEDSESWALLLGALACEKNNQKSNIVNMINFVQNDLKPTESVKNWLNSLLVSVN